MAGRTIPRNAVVVGTGKIQGERLDIETVSYTHLTKLIYAIGAVVGLIGGVKVYGKFSSGDPDTSKTAASWFGDDKCRGEDCFSVFQDVLVHKLFLFFAVKRVAVSYTHLAPAGEALLSAHPSRSAPHAHTPVWCSGPIPL